MNIGIASLPASNMDINGDSYLIKNLDDQILLTVIDGLGKQLSENFRLLCVFVAEAEITSVSDPWETPVICHVAVAVPVDSVAMLKVDAATEK